MGDTAELVIEKDGVKTVYILEHCTVFYGNTVTYTYHILEVKRTNIDEKGANKMIAIGCDHAAVNLKKAIMAHLDEKQIPYVDLGTDGTSCDYPVIAKAVCEKVLSGEAEKGILLCGTGIGMSIAANKFKGIRAAVCSDCFSVRYTRLHNNANVLCMGERVIGQGLALELVDIFLETGYEGGRHQRRLDLITDIENKE